MRGVNEYGKFRNIFLVRLSYLCLQRTVEPVGKHKANRLKTWDPQLTSMSAPPNVGGQCWFATNFLKAFETDYF